MNKDEQIKALAELGGYTEREGVMEYDGAYMPWTIMERDGNEYNSTDKRFDYLTSHDAIIPILVNQAQPVKQKIIDHFIDDDRTFISVWNFATATPQQLAEAILRAIGKWQETK